MLFKRGSTISAAEGGCQAEVGGKLFRGSFRDGCSQLLLVACSMASAGFAACMGGMTIKPFYEACLRCLTTLISRAGDGLAGKLI